MVSFWLFLLAPVTTIGCIVFAVLWLTERKLRIDLVTGIEQMHEIHTRTAITKYNILVVPTLKETEKW